MSEANRFARLGRAAQARKALAACVAVATCAMAAACGLEPVGSEPAGSKRVGIESQGSESIEAFALWAEAYVQARPSERSALEAEGLRLAETRRQAMRALIAFEPGRAVRASVSASIAAQLPASIASRIDRRVSGVGDFRVLDYLRPDGSNLPTTERLVDLGGVTYRAFVSDASAGRQTSTGVALSGVAVDDLMAVDDASFTATPLASTSDWATGTKRVLVMRVDFSDAPGDPYDPLNKVYFTTANATSIMADVTAFFSRVSYGKLTLQPTITPLLRLPRTKAEYISVSSADLLRGDAQTVAAAAGFAYSDYDLDVVVFSRLPWYWQGLGFVHGRGAWINGYLYPFVFEHELGHNLGCWHSSAWQASMGSIIGPGTSIEYGDAFDVMGHPSVGEAFMDFNGSQKALVGWFTTTQVANVSESATYSVHQMDGLGATDIGALRVPRDADADYWVEFRPNVTDAPALANGALIHWAFASAQNTRLLDMQPETAAFEDAPLILGRTFSDEVRGVHITPVHIDAGPSPTLDVVVRLGFFPKNRAPSLSLVATPGAVAPGAPVTLTATAVDADGDALAYTWEFGDGTRGGNTASESHTWAASGEYVVRCVVSDTFGGIASANLVVAVGSPGTYRIAGHVRTTAGAAVEGARVSVGGANIGYTDSSGAFVLAGLTSGPYEVTAEKNGFATAPKTFINPVTVGPSASGIDFEAIAGAHNINGRVEEETKDGIVGVPGVLITADTRTCTTDGNGYFHLSGLADGLYTVTASKPGYEIEPNPIFFANPVEVNGADVKNANFKRVQYYVHGKFSGGATFIRIGIEDGAHAAYAWEGYGGVWQYGLLLPKGEWNLVARSPGYTLFPSGFTNPVTVTSELDNLDFVAVAGDSAVVSGSVTLDGAPLARVLVTDGTRSSRTDSLGHFAITAVPDGDFTLSASATDFAFTPLVRTGAVTDHGDVTGQDFEARSTAGNTSPSISGIADQEVRIGAAPRTIPFTIADAETSTSSLILSARSTSEIVSPDGIVFTGSGAARSVTVTPVASGLGRTHITITVSDGALEASSEFDFTVLPANRPALAQNTAIELVSGGSAPINLAATDADGDTLSFRIVETVSHGSLTGVAPAIVYAAPADFVGVDTLTFVANDGIEDSNVGHVLITVGAVSPADGGAVDADGGAVDADGGAVDADGGAVDADGGAVDADGGSVDTDGGDGVNPADSGGEGDADDIAELPSDMARSDCSCAGSPSTLPAFLGLVLLGLLRACRRRGEWASNRGLRGPR